MKVSAIVMCHGQSAYLREALQSLLVQTHPDLEAVVATGDGESAKVASQFQEEHSSFNLVVLQGLGHGRGDAFNRAVAASSGELLVRLDADDTLVPTAIEKMVAAWEAGGADPHTIVTSDFEYFGDRTGLHVMGGYTREAELSNNHIHCSSLFTRALWNETKGYEISLWGHEDWAFWISCTRHDPTVLKVDEPLLRYRQHGEAASEFCYRHDGVLRAAIRILNRDLYSNAPIAEDLRTIENCPEEVAAKFLQREEWFPGDVNVKTFAAVVRNARAVRERSLEAQRAEAAEGKRVNLICVSMILKDEAHCIEKTIDSCDPWVDRWCILDTGSTDGTQDLLKKKLGGKLELYEEPFVDFATSRNRALDLCGRASEFILMLSADEEVVEPKALRHYLLQRLVDPSLRAEAYQVKVDYPGCVYDSYRVMRSRAPWRYTGVTHEVLVRPGGNPSVDRVEGAHIIHHQDSKADSQQERYKRDVRLLSVEVEKNPTDTRSWFYLGLSKFWTGDNVGAIHAMQKRVELGGWGEEVFYARLIKARASCRLGLSWKNSLELYLGAHSARPSRAEPLADVAKHYHEAEDHASCVLFASRAFAIPYPTQDVLFVEKAIYDWASADYLAIHAYYLEGRENHELGMRAATHALKACPGDARMLENVRHYLTRKL